MKVLMKVAERMSPELVNAILLMVNAIVLIPVSNGTMNGWLTVAVLVIDWTYGAVQTYRIATNKKNFRETVKENLQLMLEEHE